MDKNETEMGRHRLDSLQGFIKWWGQRKSPWEVTFALINYNVWWEQSMRKSMEDYYRHTKL